MPIEMYDAAHAGQAGRDPAVDLFRDLVQGEVGGDDHGPLVVVPFRDNEIQGRPSPGGGLFHPEIIQDQEFKG